MYEHLNDSIRVYIYTADNGYSWQGCDAETSDSLKKCIGNPSTVAAGGIRRGAVGGLNGTAVYRRSLRIGGDFAGRDSSYIALAFLPFLHIGDRNVDFAKLWDHPFLAKPRGRGESLEGLSIDLSAEGMLLPPASSSSSSHGGWWTSGNSFAKDGEPAALLAELGSLFQSRKTELGSLSAKLSENGMRISAEIEYTPFEVVAEAMGAHDAYLGAISAGAEGRRLTEAYGNWKNAVAKLEGLSNQESGMLRHFLGFCEFANGEKKALVEALGGKEEMKCVEDAVEFAESMLKLMGTRLHGTEGPIFDAIESHLEKSGDALPRLRGDTSSLFRRCGDCKEVLKGLRRQSDVVAEWFTTLKGDGEVSLPPPNGTDKVLLDMQELVLKLRGDQLSARNDLAMLKKKVDALKANATERMENENAYLGDVSKRASASHGEHFKPGVQLDSKEDSHRGGSRYRARRADHFDWVVYVVLSVSMVIVIVWAIIWWGSSKRNDAPTSEQVDKANVERGGTGNGGGDRANETCRKKHNSDSPQQNESVKGKQSHWSILPWGKKKEAPAKGTEEKALGDPVAHSPVGVNSCKSAENTRDGKAGTAKTDRQSTSGEAGMRGSCTFADKSPGEDLVETNRQEAAASEGETSDLAKPKAKAATETAAHPGYSNPNAEDGASPRNPGGMKTGADNEENPVINSGIKGDF